MLRVPVDRIEVGDQTLDARAVRHVARVLRVRRGERVMLFDPERTQQAVAEVLEVDKRGVLCRVDTIETSRLAPLPATTLIQAIGKGDKFDAIVRDATELGATHIVAAETARCIVHLGEKSAARAERWRRVAREAARQSGRDDAPRIDGPYDWAEALRTVTDVGALRICLWENAVDPLGPLLAQCGNGPVVVAVGPEGGFDSAEVDMARDAGFAFASLGPIILRTETVAAAILGATLVQRQVAQAAQRGPRTP